ncbi:hypothetical protein DLJ53_23605 [Acuticoccus sediminis]|uniref:Uncharacterized protein n=1 Tax=Acuticoccus sediminis TaxID=2184697 RepID=A0A8B2NR58_9HYPH|nr:hypothetical protein [Acuticoccus sediminis]RAH99501.1 hypothetical protein DLJ53_23605 [Acuticoccus sediminis]
MPFERTTLTGILPGIEDTEEFRLEYAEAEGPGPDGSLFEGDPEEEEELQTRPSPETTTAAGDDCGPDGPPLPAGDQIITGDCGPEDPLAVGGFSDVAGIGTEITLFF